MLLLITPLRQYTIIIAIITVSLPLLFIIFAISCHLLLRISSAFSSPYWLLYIDSRHYAYGQMLSYAYFIIMPAYDIRHLRHISLLALLLAYYHYAITHYYYYYYYDIIIAIVLLSLLHITIQPYHHYYWYYFHFFFNITYYW